MTCLNQDLCIGDTEIDDLYEKKIVCSHFQGQKHPEFWTGKPISVILVGTAGILDCTWTNTRSLPYDAYFATSGSWGKYRIFIVLIFPPTKFLHPGYKNSHIRKKQKCDWSLSKY